MVTYRREHDNLTFEIEGLLYPELSAEVEKWLRENKIKFEYWEHKWGDGGFQYNAYIGFENEDDAVLFKMTFA